MAVFFEGALMRLIRTSRCFGNTSHRALPGMPVCLRHDMSKTGADRMPMWCSDTP